MNPTFPRSAASIAVIAVLSAVPAAASAQAPAEPWQFRGQIYLWLPGVSGQTNFPPSQGGGGASVDMSDYFSLGNLQAVFMAGLEARRGRWGALTDFIYLDFDERKSGTRDLTLDLGPGGRIPVPVDASADVGLRLRGWEWTLAGTYGALRTPQYELQVLGGVRYLKVDTTLDWRLAGNIGALPPQSVVGSATVKPDYWDAIVGVRGRFDIAQSRWFVPYHFDIGTGQSDRTWQASVAVGYAFGWGELMAAYRQVGWDFKSGSPVERLTFTGPLVSAAFKW